MTFTEALRQSLESTWEQIVAIVPQLLAAVALLAAGWLRAKLLRRFAIRLFRWLRLDEVAEKAGVEDFLVQGRGAVHRRDAAGQPDLLVRAVRGDVGGAQRGRAGSGPRPAEPGAAVHPQCGGGGADPALREPAGEVRARGFLDAIWQVAPGKIAQ